MTPESGSMSVPSWFPKAGYAALAATLLTLIAIAFLVLGRFEVPDEVRMIIGLIVAVGMAAATTFLGGKAVLSGSVPIPGAQGHALQISIAGGIAVFVIVLWVIDKLYGSETTRVRSLQIVEFEPTRVTLGESALLTATFKSSRPFHDEVTTEWRVNNQPIQDSQWVRQPLHIPGSPSIFANYLFLKAGTYAVYVEVRHTTGDVITRIGYASTKVNVVPPATSPMAVPVTVDEPFGGKWYVSFYFLGAENDPPKPWFAWVGELHQTGNQVEGNLTSGQYIGDVRGTAEANTLNGSVRFPWDAQDWWPEFRLVINPDGQTATGSAKYLFDDRRGVHAYRVDAKRLPN